MTARLTPLGVFLISIFSGLALGMFASSALAPTGWEALACALIGVLATALAVSIPSGRAGVARLITGAMTAIVIFSALLLLFLLRFMI